MIQEIMTIVKMFGIKLIKNNKKEGKHKNKDKWLFG